MVFVQSQASNEALDVSIALPCPGLINGLNKASIREIIVSREEFVLCSPSYRAYVHVMALIG